MGKYLDPIPPEKLIEESGVQKIFHSRNVKLPNGKNARYDYDEYGPTLKALKIIGPEGCRELFHKTWGDL